MFDLFHFHDMKKYDNVIRGHVDMTLLYIVLFCRISSLLQGSFAKETYNIIDHIDMTKSYDVIYDNIICCHVDMKISYIVMYV